MKRRFFWVLGVLLIPRPSNAYIDPNSGSLVAQLLIGAGAGVLVLIRIFWRKIKSWFLDAGGP